MLGARMPMLLSSDAADKEMPGLAGYPDQAGARGLRVVKTGP